MYDSVAEKDARATSLAENIWRFCTSIKLALFLILIICVLALISIFLIQLPQGMTTGSPEYVGWLDNVVHPDFGIWTDTLAFFGLFDVFHSFIFLGVGALLMLSILCCTINRWRTIKMVLRGGSIPKNPDYYLNASSVYSTMSPANTAVLSINNILLRHRYRVRTKESQGSFFIAADKNALSRLGTFISHLSLILLVLGFLLGSFLGFRNDTFVVAEGTVREVGHATGLSLGLVSFGADYWPDGIPRDYRSEVIVYQDGQPVVRDTIRVNHPLTCSGIRFYQSFFGPAAEIKVRTADGAEVTDTTVAFIGMMEAGPFQRPLGRLALPGTELTAYIVAPAANTPDPILAENQVGLEIYRGEATVPSSWVILDEGMSREIEGLEFAYIGSKAFSGFSIKYDPGIWLVWLAFGLFLAGVIPVLYLPFRQLHIMVKPENESSDIYIRSSGRQVSGRQDEVKKLQEDMASVLSAQTIAGKRERNADE